MSIIKIGKFLLLCFSFLVLTSLTLPDNLIIKHGKRALTSFSDPRIIRVKEDFLTIQEAIDNANAGDTILVSAGIYYEHAIVHKTVSLVGENSSTTIIDGSNSSTVVQITANNVNISNFKLQNSGWGWYLSGIETQGANNCRIENNILFHTCHNIRLNGSRDCLIAGNKIDHVNQMGYGIRLTESTNCTVTDNFVAKNIGGIVFENSSNCMAVGNNVTRNSDGIRLYSSSSNNKISANNVFNNSYCGMIYPLPDKPPPQSNIIFHNNFINNTNPFIIQSSGNIWDTGYPSGGNYWSLYNCTDLYSGPSQNETGNDGIGDTSYPIGGQDVDKYPLMYPWSNLPVHNINTGIAYNAIQEAIDSSETMNGHTLWVDSGVYRQNVNVYKSLTLIGEDESTTIVDGSNVGTVLSVTADSVDVVGFTIRNSGSKFIPYGMDCGVFLNHSIGSSISHCLIKNNQIGIYLFFSEANSIEHSIVSSNRANGVWLWYSSNNILKENMILNNSYNFGVFGGEFSDFNNSIDTSNTVDGKSIQYLIGVKDKIIDNPADIGILYLINCCNVTVRNLSLTRNGHGVFCYNVTDSRIENVITLENNYGIYLQGSSNNVIDNNHCLNNWVGICLQSSNHNLAESNIAADCEKGISLYEADDNNLEGNTILNNLYGIRFFSSHSNEVFHNNLIENTEQVSLISSYQNVWDNGFEGNFWSDYNGLNTDRDGLGYPAKIIDDSNCDLHPLWGSFHKFRVNYEGKLYNVTVISNSTVLSFVFEKTSKTIVLTVNGTYETHGFCRICIPHALIEPEIVVIIDDGFTEVLYSNYTLRDDGFCRWIYFAYQHSTHEILIVPEFCLTISLSILMIASFWCLLFKKKKL